VLHLELELKGLNMDNHLNFFLPYERAPAWHENQLTRALLVVLRYSPIAHQAWLRLVVPDWKCLIARPDPTYLTQYWLVLVSSGVCGNQPTRCQ